MPRWIQQGAIGLLGWRSLLPHPSTNHIELA
jgi:hypothetical protein